MPFTAADIAQQLQGRVIGDSSVVLSGFASANGARVGDLTFAENALYFEQAENSAASAVLVGNNFSSSRKTLIQVSNPRVAFSAVDVLVNSAAVNIPARSLAEITLDNYRKLLETNLTGAYLCTQAFLPGMRQRGSGTIINIISEAGKQASPKSGPAYVMSKFGLAGLTQSINAEERANGIRACAIFPGDIDTPLLDQRAAPPSAEARQKMLRAEDVAECALLAVNLPARAVVEEILIRPR